MLKCICHYICHFIISPTSLRFEAEVFFLHRLLHRLLAQSMCTEYAKVAQAETGIRLIKSVPQTGSIVSE